MMQPTDAWNRNHPASVRQFDIARHGRVTNKRKMRPILIIIGEIRSEDSQQVPFVENDEMIKALATDRTDEWLDVGRLPERTIRNDDFLCAHSADALLKHVAVDVIAITNQKPW